MTPLFLRGRKSGAVGLVRQTRTGEWGAGLQVRLGFLQTLAHRMAEIGRDRQTGNALRAFITGGDLERRSNKLPNLGRQRDGAGRAVSKIRLTRDEDRNHGYPKECAKDHETKPSPEREEKPRRYAFQGSEGIS